MIVGVGIDLVEISRIRTVFKRHPTRFVERVLTISERAYVLRHADPSARIAGRWAVKEAALKALGTGLSNGIRWQDVEVLPDEAGKPILRLHGKALERAEFLGANSYHATITHSQEMAMAQVILERI
jgi:holo-[acyl-carrier protein] synthase